MASISLPKVLQQRKTSLEQERENFEKFQHISIGKAISSTEHPVKEKHVRSAIMGTFREKSSETFWACALRLPLQENRIVAWKFCHVVHKVLREGHPNVIVTSYKHISTLEDLGKLWGHLKEGYGRLIQQYTTLIICKLKFHARNPRIPGNLSLTSDELDSIGENDINNYFQLSVEIFDYMDEILFLQEAIFGSLDMSRSNSMTSCGQCRLAPLISCILDSSQLYDISVKILFRLHGSLPPDLLSGHRQRFLGQFKILRKFYISASSLQYFKNLIQVPILPENPPNFLIQAELTSYVTPVVLMPEDPAPAIGELVDLATSSTSDDQYSLASSNNNCNGNISPDIIIERDNLIEHLQNELSRIRLEMDKIISDRDKIVSNLNEKISILEMQVAKKESELLEEKLTNTDLLQQIGNLSKKQEAEQKTKALEEKFQKLKEVYGKLREEHIQLIRQKAGVDKQLRGSEKMTKFARKANKLITKIKADVDKQLATVKANELDINEKNRLESLAVELASLQQSTDQFAEQNMILENKLEYLTNEKDQVENRLQQLVNQKQDLDVRVETLSIDNQKLKKNSDKLSDAIITEVIKIVENSIHEVDNPVLSSSTCSLDYLTSLVSPLRENIENVENSPTIRLEQIVSLSHKVAQFIIIGKFTSATSPDIEFGDEMSTKCKLFGKSFLTSLREMKTSINLSIVKEKLNDILNMREELDRQLRGSSSESIGDLVESELVAMVKAIEEASEKLQEMLNQSRKEDTGIKLEVNEKILDSCTGLMKAIRILVQKSRILQAEIVAQGRGSATAKEFYKRNHQWTEGLISAAKSVGMGAKYLLEAADEIVSSGGKIEYVVVAAQSVMASTAQLVVASRVKADRNSNALEQLRGASRGVTQATATVLTSAKLCSDLVTEQSDDFDIKGLSLHNVKRLEMEAQVKVLEYENMLAKERLKLAALRRHHYSIAPESDQLPPS